MSAVAFLLSSPTISLRLFLLPPLPAFPWLGFLPLLVLPLLPPFPWAPPTADARRCLLSCASSSCHLTMNRSAASATTRYHFPAFSAGVDHSAASPPNTKAECSVDLSVAWNSLRSATMLILQACIVRQVSGSPIQPSPQKRNPTGESLLALSCHGPLEKSRRMYPNGCLDALVTCHLDGLCVREGGMVSIESALEAKDSQEALVVSRSKLGKGFHSEDPRHPPVPQCLNFIVLQYAGSPAMRGGCPIIRLWAQPFEACPHETDPSVDSEREVSVFVDNVAYK